MDGELTTMSRRSGPILNVLLASDDQFGPGLADCECLHGTKGSRTFRRLRAMAAHTSARDPAEPARDLLRLS